MFLPHFDHLLEKKNLPDFPSKIERCFCFSFHGCLGFSSVPSSPKIDWKLLDELLYGMNKRMIDYDMLQKIVVEDRILPSEEEEDPVTLAYMSFLLHPCRYTDYASEEQTFIFSDLGESKKLWNRAEDLGLLDIIIKSAEDDDEEEALPSSSSSTAVVLPTEEKESMEEEKLSLSSVVHYLIGAKIILHGFLFHGLCPWKRKN